MQNLFQDTLCDIAKLKERVQDRLFHLSGLCILDYEITEESDVSDIEVALDNVDDDIITINTLISEVEGYLSLIDELAHRVKDHKDELEKRIEELNDD